MSLDWFWDVVDRQLAELRTASTATDVLRILGQDRNPYRGAIPSSGDAFYAGGDGDDMWAALLDAGWKPVWTEATYHWAMQAPDGSVITYVEGDIYRGNRKPLPHGGNGET